MLFTSLPVIRDLKKIQTNENNLSLNYYPFYLKQHDNVDCYSHDFLAAVFSSILCLFVILGKLWILN